MQLGGKVAIVTGAAMGIGRSFALALAREGASVVLADRAAEQAAAVQQEIEAAGGQALAVGVDISDSQQVNALIQKGVQRFGKIDVLFNVAGVIERELVVNMEEAAWDKVLDVNLKGTFLCSRAVAKQMLKQGTGGKIINTASGLAMRPDATGAAYAASKAGVIAFSQALAEEVGPLGINVNVFIPGITDTPMYRAIRPGDEQAADYAKTRQIAGRPYQPDEYAGMAVFLASDASNYMHSKII